MQDQLAKSRVLRKPTGGKSQESSGNGAIAPVSDGLVSTAATETIVIDDPPLQIVNHISADHATYALPPPAPSAANALNDPFDFVNDFYSPAGTTVPYTLNQDLLFVSPFHSFSSGQSFTDPNNGVGFTGAQDTQLEVVTPPLRGRFTLKADGTFQYSPLPGFVGTDSFTLKATDGFQDATFETGNSSADTVTVSIAVYDPSKVQDFPTESATWIEANYPPPDTNRFNEADSTGLAGQGTTELLGPAGSDLVDVEAVANPSRSGDYPPGLNAGDFPNGFCHFQVQGIPAPPPPAVAPPATAAFQVGMLGSLFHGSFEVCLTYTTLTGETDPSIIVATPDLLPNQSLTILSPATVPGATGWKVYASPGDPQPFTLQGGTNRLGDNLTLRQLNTTGLLAPRPAGGNTILTIILPASAPAPLTYYKFGPTPDDLTDHWYQFLFDGNTGAVLPGEYDPVLKQMVEAGRIVLHFVDGQRGDDDVNDLATDGVDGTIEDTGGPVFGLPALTAAINGPPDGVRGQARAFTLTAQEPGTASSTGFMFAVHWGDGTPVQTINPTPGNGAGVPVNHAFAAAGTYMVQVTAMDPLGQSSIVASQSTKPMFHQTRRSGYQGNYALQ